MARRPIGISGSAVLAGTAALYLIYVGVKDVPFLEGIRSLLRKEKPPTGTHSAYELKQITTTGNVIGSAVGQLAEDQGITQLVGNAKSAYSVFRKQGKWKIIGWGIRPSGTSDHPLGKALDIMNPTDAEAQSIIATFRTLKGAHYWIWKRQIANSEMNNWSIRPYVGLSPHTDHVHLSFF